ncbi:hypothetical protein ASPZODRAFT_19346 [Penicilliopsis zonata CBS 506.65]|uniref:Uncharacterized protein n=1 Tax=Penicilliopsis zonata CBS 506.65 TaxID=1073090 RepID=A0A1L9S8Z4_9EURO|nr:hypothetical protein ASPZODRAFT_19346 [Penicilliopsis zonata CBS 506.65]OJJ43625.1 hypothetical protein ASPZODRAFT_19346 [Penicilliopsis zonata CBS 506.65]
MAFDSGSSTHSRGDSVKSTLQSKADPNVALREAQPMDHFMVSTTTFSLRSMQFRDRNGNIITDPDHSNPTRARLERPLETIMSFQRDIESHHRQDVMATR